MRRVRSGDPESAELADVAIAALKILEFIWMTEEACPIVARFWSRIRLAVEVAPIADLATAADAAHGLRDLGRRYPYLAADLEEVAVTIERRAWERERRRLGIGAGVPE
jgi:hypothetical protein